MTRAASAHALTRYTRARYQGRLKLSQGSRPKCPHGMHVPRPLDRYPLCLYSKQTGKRHPPVLRAVKVPNSWPSTSPKRSCGTSVGVHNHPTWHELQGQSQACSHNWTYTTIAIAKFACDMPRPIALNLTKLHSGPCDGSNALARFTTKLTSYGKGGLTGMVVGCKKFPRGPPSLDTAGENEKAVHR